MREIDRQRILKELKDYELRGMKVFFVRPSFILHNEMVVKLESLVSDINKKISSNEPVEDDEVIRVLDSVDEFLIDFNKKYIRNRGGYSIKLEYSLSINSIVINVIYFSPSGNMYYIDDEHYRVLSLYKNEENIDTLKEYIKSYSDEGEGRVKYLLNENNEILVENNIDVEKVMDIINLLADSTLDSKLNNKVNIDDISYHVSTHYQMADVSKPKEFKIISFKILSNDINLNLKNMEEYKIKLINDALLVCIENLNNSIGIYQRDIARCGLKRKSSRYEMDDVDKINIFKGEISSILDYQSELRDNIGKDFNINIKNNFIMQILYRGLLPLRDIIIKEIELHKQKMLYSEYFECEQELKMSERKFDFCTKIIETLEPNYKGLPDSKIIKGI